jgi:outer membrane immunogenic protein
VSAAAITIALTAPAAAQDFSHLKLTGGGSLGIGFSSNKYEGEEFGGAGPAGGGQIGFRSQYSPNWWWGGEVGLMTGHINGQHEGVFGTVRFQTSEMALIGIPSQWAGTPLTWIAGFGATQSNVRVGSEFGFFHESWSGTIGGWTARFGAEVPWQNVLLGMFYEYSHVDGDVRGEPVKIDQHLLKLTVNYQTGLLGRMPPVTSPRVAPTPPQFVSWAGFTFGAHVGYGWNQTDWNDDVFALSGHTGGGALGGGQIAYTWELGDGVVMGLEGTASASSLTGGFECNSWKCYDKTSSIYSFQPNVGLVTGGNNLFYVTGGIAWAHTEYRSDWGFHDHFVGSQTRSGWTAGFGWQHRVNESLSLDFRYSHFDFGNRDVVLNSNTGVDHTWRVGVGQTADTVTIGANWKLSSGSVNLTSPR